MVFSRLAFPCWLVLSILIAGHSSAQGTLETPLRWGEPAPPLRLQKPGQGRKSINPLQNSNQKQVLLLVFGDLTCPAYHLYLGRILKLQPQVSALNGDWLWIYPHSVDSSVLPYQEAQAYRDFGGHSQKAYVIQRLPTVVLLQKETKPPTKGSWIRRFQRRQIWSVRYVGAVDQDPEGRTTGIRQDLEEALRDLVYSPYVRIPLTRSHGCPLPTNPSP